MAELTRPFHKPGVTTSTCEAVRDPFHVPRRIRRCLPLLCDGEIGQDCTANTTTQTFSGEVLSTPGTCEYRLSYERVPRAIPQPPADHGPRLWPTLIPRPITKKAPRSASAQVRAPLSSLPPPGCTSLQIEQTLSIRTQTLTMLPRRDTRARSGPNVSRDSRCARWLHAAAPHDNL